MASQPEVPTYDAGVYEYEISDPVQGGVNGIANLPLLNLANRTAYLKQRLDSLVNGTIIPPTVAPLNGAAFTGSTTAPNVAPGDDSTLIANTDFVQTRHHGLAVVSVGGVNITLSQAQWGVGIIVFQGVLTSNISVLFPASAGAWIVANQSTGTFSLTCRTAAGTGVVIPQSPSQYQSIWCDGPNIHPQNSPFLLNLTNPMIIAALGFTPVQQGGGISQGLNKVYLGSDIGNNGRLRAQVDLTDIGRLTMASDFSLTVSNFQQYMYHKSASGMILQGNVGSSITGADTISFPNAFPTACVEVIACEGNPQGWFDNQVAGGGGNFNTTFGTQNYSRFNFALYVNGWNGLGWTLRSGVSFRYIAIGY
jgi:hypothetical protein